MSDAVYECNLVGLELKNFESKCGSVVDHLVFVDGKTQWEARKSDLTRLLDLEAQGLVSQLFVGSDVETRWGKESRIILKKLTAPLL